MKEMITVEKEVYEAVLRNSVKVADLEAENQRLREMVLNDVTMERANKIRGENQKLKAENLQLKQKVTSRNKRLQKYKKLKGELATLASNRNILIKRLKEENEKLKSTLNDVDYFFTYGIARWGVVDLRRSVKEALI